MANCWDLIIDNASKELPPFNEYLLKDYRREQIDKCISFMAMTFQEAIRLFDGEIVYRGMKILTPEERLKATLFNPKYTTSTVEVTQTELMLVEFQFEYQKEIFKTQLYLPYFVDNAIIINGAKYYIQFALTDSVFYHIVKENGIGIKVLRAHLRFWRNLRHSFVSTSGTRYTDHIIVVKAHMKPYKYTAEDVKSALVLYPLSKFGWNYTLQQYGIRNDQLSFSTNHDPNDPTYDYFEIREKLYLKVDKTLISTNPTIDMKIKMNVVSSIHYVLQYFTRWEATIFSNNEELIHHLTNEPNNVPWKVILGKSIYGIDYPNEIQVCGHAEQHLESLDSYLDNYTKNKLREIAVKCDTIYDLLDHVFLHMDEYVVNYSPANLYEKRVNVLDLLLGNIVRNIFHKVYKKTNNKKGGKMIADSRDVESLFKMGMKAIAQIHKCNQVVAGNPSVYNDNYLLTVGGRKVLSTHSTSSGGTKVSDGRAQGKSTGSQKANLLSSPVHRYHQSWSYVTSMLCISHQNPGVAGTINPFLAIDTMGKIVTQEYVHDMDPLIPYLITR